MRKILGVFVLGLLLAAPQASAAIIFSDNFDTENAGVGILNYTGFANFGVSGGTVDLIGNGFYSFPPVTDGHGLYVDLDGSTRNAGLMLSDPIAVGPGDYTLTFDLAGSQRGDFNTVNVKIFLDGAFYVGGGFGLSSATPFSPAGIGFSLATGGQLTFSIENEGADNLGALLDNIVLEGPAAVPEPASLLLLGTGLIGLARWRKRRE